jgi:hypothetical protein
MTDGYELSRELDILQTYQFGNVDDPRRVSDEFVGRPDLRRLLDAKDSGYNYVWLFTKIEGQPQLCDGLSLVLAAIDGGKPT